MKLKVSAGGVPPGNYSSTFAGVEQCTNEKYGSGLKWKFAISNGPQTGQIATRVTGLTPSPKNGCGKVLCGLVGRPLAVEEEVEIESLVGRAYLIVVIAAEGGGSRVDAVIAAPTK